MGCRLPLPPAPLPSLAHPKTLPVWSICLCLVSGGSAISSHIAQMVSMHASVNSSRFFFFVTANFHIKVSAFQWWGEREKLELPAPTPPPPPPSLPGSFVLIKGYCCLRCCWWGNAGLCGWLCTCVREREASVGVGDAAQPSRLAAGPVLSGKSLGCHSETRSCRKRFLSLAKHPARCLSP